MKPRALFTIVFLLISILRVNAQDNEIIWSEDFESDWYVDWHVNIGTWEVGTPTSGPQSAFSGNNCAATILNGVYPAGVETRLIRHTSFTVPSASENPAIRFWHWYNIAGDDWGEVQIKTSNGDWKSVSAKYFHTGSDIWSQTLIDLSAYADSTIQLAFYFTSGTFYDGPGWYIDEVMLVTGPQVFKYHEDFESGLGSWSVERGTWEIGTPTNGPINAYRGQNCAATKLSGTYAAKIETRLVSPRFVVPSASENPAIRFWHWYNIAGDDWGEVQIKSSEGEWETVSEKFFHSSGDIWTRPLIDLTSFADSIVQLAFYFTSGTFYDGPGWYIDEVMLVTGPQVFNNHEDFESGLSDWSVERGTWEVGIPTNGPSNAYGGQNCAGTKLDGIYSNHLDTRLVSPPFIVPTSSQNPALQFWQWFNISGSDWGEVQITIDDGITWETITDQNITTSSGSWSPFYILLTSYAGKQARISFRFRSDTFYESSGWYIDDVRILDNSELVVYAGPDITLDECGMSTINTTVSGGTEPYTIEWLPGEGLDNPTSLNPVASPSDTTTYTLRVVDANGCFRTDRVVVNANCEAANTEAEILSFSFGKPPQSGNSEIDPTSRTLTIVVNYGTDLEHLTPTFTLSKGATATVNGVTQESGITSNDFTGPVTYSITSEDGASVQDWVVNVSTAAVENPEILSFNFSTPPQAGSTIIDPVDRRVDLKVEHGTDVSGMVASFTLSEGATATVGGVVQESGSTVNDFTEAVTYTLTAVDGETVRDWVVTVDVAKLNDTDILSYSFGIPPQTGKAAVNPVSHTVDIEVEHGTDVSALVADFTLSEGATTSVGEVVQESGTTTNDFTNPVSYKVTASDEVTVQDWVVSVDVAAAVGIEEIVSHQLNIYPNPFSDLAIIEVSNPDQSILTISVFNVLGNKVFEQVVSNTETIKFSKGNLPAGNYLLVLKREKVLESKVVIIE